MSADRRAELDEAFWTFHRTNPHVYDALVRLARQGARAGRTRLGIGMLFEVLRWEHLLRTEGDPFKLNNNLRSRYARLLMHQESDLKDLFDVRELQG